MKDFLQRLDPRTVPPFWRWVGIIAVILYATAYGLIIFLDDPEVKLQLYEVKGKLMTVIIFSLLTKKDPKTLKEKPGENPGGSVP